MYRCRCFWCISCSTLSAVRTAPRLSCSAFSQAASAAASASSGLWRRCGFTPPSRLRVTACAPSTQCLRDMQNTMAGSIEGVGEERLRARRRHSDPNPKVIPPLPPPLPTPLPPSPYRSGGACSGGISSQTDSHSISPIFASSSAVNSASLTSKTAPCPSAVKRSDRTFSVPSVAPAGSTLRRAPHTKEGLLTGERIVACSVTYPSMLVSSERDGGTSVVDVARASAAATASTASPALASSRDAAAAWKRAHAAAGTAAASPLAVSAAVCTSDFGFGGESHSKRFFVKRSICSTASRSRGPYSVTQMPLRPARPVRPERWT
mmetsp:Transcript_25511/g.80891  ORF Transcript_25511/g.80891 Transcript_25511/m.80891 type:complete len:321 (-) Transcript_25511:1304-2266(-)